MSMKHLPRSLVLALGLGLAALPGLAQETAPADDLAMGVDPSLPPALKSKEEAAVGEAYFSAAFESWELRCEKTEDGKDPCQLFQLLKDGEGYPVAEFGIFPVAAGGKAAAGAAIVVPLETLLTANLAIGIDEGSGKLYPFTVCIQSGCIARIGFTTEEIAQFKKGAKATMTIVPAAAPDEKVKLDISLKGFTAGYDALQKTLVE